MKHYKYPLFVCVIFFSLLASNLQAQKNRVFFGAGLNTSYAPFDSLNYMIDQFNAENMDYEKSMPNINHPMGLDAHLGANFDGVLFDINYTMRLSSGTARGPVNSNGDQSITKMRYNANTIDIGLGYFFVNKEMTQWALGASLDFGQMRIKMRRGTASQVAGQVWSRTVSDLNLGASIFVQGMVIVSRAPQIGIYFRPYYQFGFFENDLGPANRYLRPQIGTAKPYFIYQRPSNIGLKVGIYFGG